MAHTTVEYLINLKNPKDDNISQISVQGTGFYKDRGLVILQFKQYLDVHSKSFSEAESAAFTRLVRQLKVVEDKVAIGHRVGITLSCDHRIIDGATGAKFLQELKRILENPILLTL